MKLNELTSYLDHLLRHAEVADYPNAFNGLQLEGPEEVRKLACAVDASEWVMREAAQRGADLLLVHHGFLWGGAAPVTGPLYRKLRAAISAGLAVYSSHLPLDAHPEFGNNAILARELGLPSPRPFLEVKGALLGLRSEWSLRRSELIDRLAAATGGTPYVVAAGPEQGLQVGLVTGGAGGELATAAAQGIDTFITGEGSHWTHAMAEELGVNLIYAGHYATEVFGVRALAAHLGEKFGLEWEFIDHPSGL